MNGRTHAVIGAASMTGAALSGVPIGQCAVMTVIAAGFALGPDIDHPGSTISRSMPKAIHKLAHVLSHAAREATSTTYDKKHFAWKMSKGHDPEHRTLTHTTTAGAIITAAAAGAATMPVGVLFLTVLASWWCHRLTRGLLPFLAAGVVISILVPVSPFNVAWAVGAGWLSHIIADGCTKAGVPLLWPMKIKGKRWYRVRLLGSSLASGDRREWIAGFAVAALMNSPLLLF